MSIENKTAKGSTPEDPMNGSNEFYIRTHGISRNLDTLMGFAEMDAQTTEMSFRQGPTSVEPMSDGIEPDLPSQR